MKPIHSSRFHHLPHDSPLARFLSRHDDKHSRGLITRLDRSPIAAKRSTFHKALALNACIVMLIAAVMWLSITAIFVGPQPAPLRLAFLITQDILIFSAISVIVRSTIVPFIFGECRLRLRYGFRAAEIVIRRPPMAVVTNGASPETQLMDRSLKIAIRSVDPRLLYTSASAMLSPNYWTVEYRAVFEALNCIAQGQFQEEDLEFAIWKQDNGTWNVCELWRMHEIMSDDHEVAMFKTFLAQSGKEQLLNIWQDMVATSFIERPPSPKVYQDMADEFAKQGLDYETTWIQVTERSSPVL